jgi:hypothetical protein
LNDGLDFGSSTADTCVWERVLLLALDLSFEPRHGGLGRRKHELRLCDCRLSVVECLLLCVDLVSTVIECGRLRDGPAQDVVDDDAGLCWVDYKPIRATLDRFGAGRKQEGIGDCRLLGEPQEERARLKRLSAECHRARFWNVDLETPPLRDVRSGTQCPPLFVEYDGRLCTGQNRQENYSRTQNGDKPHSRSPIPLDGTNKKRRKLCRYWTDVPHFFAGL